MKHIERDTSHRDTKTQSKAFLGVSVSLWLITLGVLGRLSVASAQSKHPPTIDDLMKLRSIVDAQISPDGSRVAYVVSTPNLAKNEHDGALFVVSADGGTPVRLGETMKIFNVPTPRPQLRWSRNGKEISLMGIASGRPEVFTIPVAGGAPLQI